MYIILPINNSPERISYLSGKRSTYVTIFNQTKSQHFIHRYGFAMDFYSSVSGILVVHISDYSGNYAYQPDCAFFLCGNSVGIGHIFQGLYLWLIPLYCLVISSNDCLMDQERGYDNILISRIGKRKMLYRLLIKNFILLSVLVFLSLSLNLLCVHLMFRGGKYNPSEISALNNFTIFWNNHPLLNNFVHILITSIIYGIMGMFCCATSFYFRNRKTVYFVSIFFWLIEILKPGSLLLIFQPFQINSTLTETASGLLLFFVPAILYICILTRRSVYE